MKNVWTAAFFLAIIAVRTPLASAQARQEFRVVGYYSLHSADVSKGRRLPFKWNRVTHVNLWFYNPDTLGNFNDHFKGLQKFIARAHRHKVKVLLSIGGGSPHPYYHTLLKDENRSAFVARLAAKAAEYDADGIDVDLEGRDIDANYQKFVVELAARLRADHRLTTAAVAVYYKDQVSDSALAAYDFVNIMSYDRTGPWRPHEAGQHSPYSAAVSDLEYFGNVRHLQPAKMNVGVPFYGYSFGPEKTSKAGSMNYGNIVKTYPGAENGDQLTTKEGATLYYNGPETIKAKSVLAAKSAGGIMIWHLRGDAKRKKSLLRVIDKVRAANAKESKP